ncbi:tryptophan-rich sensory protein TspO [Albidovulum sediminicola]|uniref:Tryptophan-rich sensory protein n=1 Tax=Albidovulum sediminicola TaxID=2984331 RepID=A0ABT2YWH5_9RHOB|nr:TspO/MBR family protein [Defluviimonas sp. WL0075]MCV2863231.1 tryptophan-rich sensory protein [Defluviimonas sp. WL0075]
MSSGGIFVIFLLACGAAAATGVIFKPGTWYEALKKPAWTPAKWVFPVVWTTLYILMAWAASRIAVLPENGVAMAFFAAQLALNTLWTPVFFGAHRIGLGLVVLVTLVVVVALTVRAFFAIDWIAGFVMLPYLAWLGVAAALNFWIWRHNGRAVS